MNTTRCVNDTRKFSAIIPSEKVNCAFQGEYKRLFTFGQFLGIIINILNMIGQDG